ncbi:hypothetical protein FIV42_26730 [Persicimonas caeni]|uniref:WD40 repeat domain-containing protein n=1 Tax=Persicimonas caeni TaxID=2292766 RepID=A0A4Y6Q0U0_PERCE|nr:hypothetical protein [Persicimonas caeni]QDG54208.1 hypothetical protein FIV42_26730 [Persicimonas caeni]QED35429.1 hypothetical protein FRD00_26725 [Persicimonas caeni]
MKRVLPGLMIPLAAVAFAACSDRSSGSGNNADAGHIGDAETDSGEPLSDDPEWHWLDVAQGTSIEALVVTDEDGVFALARANDQITAQLHLFDGQAFQPVGLELPMGANLLAGRSAETLYTTASFSSGRDGQTVAYRFDGEQWVAHLRGTLIATEVGAISDISVEADGTLWMATSGGLIMSDAANDYDQLNYTEDRFEFAETFKAVATPPADGNPRASSKNGTYSINADFSATLRPDLVTEQLLMVGADEGYAVIADPAGLTWFSGDQPDEPIAIDGFKPDGARLAGSTDTSIWVLEQTGDGASTNRVWKVTDEGPSAFDLPEDTPRLTDIAVIADDDIWFATEDGRVLRWVSPADFAAAGVDLPEPPEAPTIEQVDLPASSGEVPVAASIAMLSDGRLFIGAQNSSEAVNLVLDQGQWSEVDGVTGRLVRMRSDDADGLVAETSAGYYGVWTGDKFEISSEYLQGAATDGAGTVWASQSSKIGKLTGAQLEFQEVDGAPSNVPGWQHAAGGASEIWFQSHNSIATYRNGAWEEYSVGALAGLLDICWVGPGHVVAVGQNGTIIEVKDGEKTELTSPTSQRISYVTAVGSRVFATTSTEMYSYDGSTWSLVEFDGFADVQWSAVAGRSLDEVYFLGANPEGESVLLRVSYPD